MTTPTPTPYPPVKCRWTAIKHSLAPRTERCPSLRNQIRSQKRANTKPSWLHLRLSTHLVHTLQSSSRKAWASRTAGWLTMNSTPSRARGTSKPSGCLLWSQRPPCPMITCSDGVVSCCYQTLLQRHMSADRCLCLAHPRCRTRPDPEVQPKSCEPSGIFSRLLRIWVLHFFLRQNQISVCGSVKGRL